MSISSVTKFSASVKNGRVRVLPIFGSVVTALEEYFDISRSQLARGSGPPSEALFLNHRGKRLTRQASG